MSEVKHSPLPWRFVLEENESHHFRADIVDVGGDVVAAVDWSRNFDKCKENGGLITIAVNDWFFNHERAGCVYDERNRLIHLVRRLKPFAEIGIRATVREMFAVEGVSRLAGIETNAAAWLKRLGELEDLLRELVEVTGEDIGDNGDGGAE